MAFASNVLVDGQWTTRRLDVDTVLRHYDQQEKEITETTLVQDIEVAPTLGILTQTVIPSPLVHWILPARLRDLYTNDVAFIGDDFVQIRELQADGFLHDVVRIDNLGSRIRNARIVGSVKHHGKNRDFSSDDMDIKDEDDDDFYMDPDGIRPKANRNTQHELPPQVILLQLTSGDAVFLILRADENGTLQFVTSRRRVSNSMLKLQPGMHLTVDPSSRYAAIGCSEGVMTLCELHCRDELNEQYSAGSEVQFIVSNIHLFPNGSIVKMEFLQPAHDDENHIILVVLVANKGKTRMLTYEWETGTPLSEIRPHSTRGHPMDPSRRLPLLLIPLTVKSAFILVFENLMSVCYGLLEGTPRFHDFDKEADAPTELHHGNGAPLWISWARPLRHFTTRKEEHIFIAREDGLLKLVVLDETYDEVIKNENNIGKFSANCGTALACLWIDAPLFGEAGDVLVVGSDSGSGGTYLQSAKGTPKLLEPIQNWSPAHDMVTTYLEQDNNSAIETNGNRYERSGIAKPDRVFACVGKGLNGAIVEFRRGLEAKIKLEMDCDTHIDKSWVLNGWSGSQDGSQHECLFLLSSGNRSRALRFAGDALEIEELENTQTNFDLRYRTVAAFEDSDHIVQVTEKSIMINTGSEVKLCEADFLLHLSEGNNTVGLGSTIYHAFVQDNSVIFTTSFDGDVYLQILQWGTSATAMEIDNLPGTSNEFYVCTIGKYESNVTSLTSCTVDDQACAVVAQWFGNSSSVSLQPLCGGQPTTFDLPTSSEGLCFEPLTSMLVKPSQVNHLQLLCGTQNGVVITLEIDIPNRQIIIVRADRLGATSVTVTADSTSLYGYFATCDSKIYALLPKRLRNIVSVSDDGAHGHDIHQFWMTNPLEPGMQQPKITSFASQPPLKFEGNSRDLLLTAGSQILVVSLSPRPKALPRHMVIKGTPTRLFYSKSLEVIVVAATTLQGQSTLFFIDPETGEDISQPFDVKTSRPTEFTAGLGNLNERVFRLFEWEYTKHGKAWNFIIVSTSTGRLLIIAVENHEQIRKDIQKTLFHANGEFAAPRSRINYYTRYKFKSNDPVYSVTGYPDGILWCSGNTLNCDALDLTAKKFKRLVEYTLPSPAINLSYNNNEISALTLRHSLEILQLTTNDLRQTTIIRTHGDQVTRSSLHHITNKGPTQRSIHLVSDKDCSLVGLWPTKGTMADTLDTVFEASLPNSVLRFRYARCRPTWDPKWLSRAKIQATSRPLQLENLQSSEQDTELLGLSITGALSHYTILDVSTWKFLRFIIDLAIRSQKACKFNYRTDDVPTRVTTVPKLVMHIDGDILRRCLDQDLIEDLLDVVDGKPHTPHVFTTFCELLQELHQGSLESGAMPIYYIRQAYRDLDFFLRPILQ